MSHETKRPKDNNRHPARRITKQQAISLSGIKRGAALIMTALLLAGCVHVKDTPEILYSPIEYTSPEAAPPAKSETAGTENAAGAGQAAGKTAAADKAEEKPEAGEEAKTETQNVEKLSVEEVQAAIDIAMPGMDCWGDSITEGFLGDGVNWPDTFREILNERLIRPIREASGYDSLSTPIVRNMGVSTETVPEITGRRGAVPFVLPNDIVIPSEKTAVEIQLVSSDRGQVVKPLRYGDGSYGGNGINPVTIAGVRGELTRVFDPGIDSSRYYFERSEEGDVAYARAGEPVRTCSADLYSNDFCVVMMGANGGYQDAADLAVQFGKMAAMQNNSRYLLVGMGCTPVDSGLLTPQEEAILAQVFGDRFISLQAWMSRNGIDYANYYLNAGIEPSERDLERMNAGYTPYCLLNEDGLHYTPDGYRVIAYMIFDEMDRRGFFDELKTVPVSRITQDPS